MGAPSAIGDAELLAIAVKLALLLAWEASLGALQVARKDGIISSKTRIMLHRSDPFDAPRKDSLHRCGTNAEKIRKYL